VNRPFATTGYPTTDSHLPVRSWSLWIDGCGGFGIIDDVTATIGRTGCDVNVIGDVSRLAGCVSRRGEDWYWSPGSTCEKPDADWLTVPGKIPVGGTVLMSCLRPSPLSAMIRLDIAAPHRFDTSIDAVLIGTGVIVIGRGGHIEATHLETPVILKKDNEHWELRRGQQSVRLRPGLPTRLDNLSLVMQPCRSSSANEPKP
jgi:hypothetical protein